jgi:hypothetical protein
MELSDDHVVRSGGAVLGRLCCDRDILAVLRRRRELRWRCHENRGEKRRHFNGKIAVPGSRPEPVARKDVTKS